jgi:hypothetical protein
MSLDIRFLGNRDSTQNAVLLLQLDNPHRFSAGNAKEC